MYTVPLDQINKGQAGEELVLGPGGFERWDHQTVVRRRLWSLHGSDMVHGSDQKNDIADASGQVSSAVWLGSALEIR